MCAQSARLEDGAARRLKTGYARSERSTPRSSRSKRRLSALVEGRLDESQHVPAFNKPTRFATSAAIRPPVERQNSAAGALRFFPRGFNDRTYLAWEREYKEHTHRRWLEVLDRRRYAERFVDGDYVRLAADRHLDFARPLFLRAGDSKRSRTCGPARAVRRHFDPVLVGPCLRTVRSRRIWRGRLLCVHDRCTYGNAGAALVLAPSPVYEVYLHRARGDVGNALTDQQIAGLVMWIPAGILLTLAGLAFVGAWMGEAERRGHPPNRTHA